MGQKQKEKGCKTSCTARRPHWTSSDVGIVLRLIVYKRRI